MRFIVTAVTDIGICREKNQDSTMVCQAYIKGAEVVFGVVCDGMGGHEQGEVASSMVLQAAHSWFNKEFPKLMESTLSPELLRYSWIQTLQMINDELVLYGKEIRGTLGSTVVMLLVIEKEYFVVNVGDSSGFAIEYEELPQKLSEDHTVVELEVKAGRLTRSQAMQDPRKHILYQCVGMEQTLKPFFQMGKITEERYFLLCSDGFLGKITPQEISKALGKELKSQEQLKNCILNLIQLNKERKETDNLSVVVIKV